MTPVKTDTANVVLVAEGCNDLPATKYTCDDGTPGVEICWELTPEELNQLVEVEHPRLYLYLLSDTVPPMLLSTKCRIRVEEMEEATE